MSIHTVQGDLLLSRCDAWAHGCNAKGVMGAGIARRLKEKFPSLFYDYQAVCASGELPPGGIHIWENQTGCPRFVVNLCTQDGLDGARLPYVDQAFQFLRAAILSKELPVQTLAMPQIGAGLGRLSWMAIVPIVKRCLDDLPVRIYVYEKYLPGIRAVEA